MASNKRAVRGIEPGPRTEWDLAGDRQGKNRLQGDDQHNVHNQRQKVPGSRDESDEIRESYAKLDKQVRARTDLGKGNRKHKTGGE